MRFSIRASLLCLATLTTNSASAEEVREWVDISGKHKIQAEYLKTEDGKAKLRRPDGKKVSIPINRLSEADRRFIQTQESGRDSSTLIDPVVRIVAPIQRSSRNKSEIQLVGCVVQSKGQAYPVVVASRSSLRNDSRTLGLDAGLANAVIFDLLSPKQLGQSSRLGFPQPRSNEVAGLHDLLIILQLEQGSELRAFPLANRDPAVGDAVRIPLLPSPRRGGAKSRKPISISWTSWKIVSVDSQRLYVEPEDGKFPYSGTLPIINSSNELVGLYATKVATSGKSKVGDGAPVSVIKRAIAKASFDVPSDGLQIAGSVTSRLPPIPNTPIDNNASWRNSYEALAEAVQSKRNEESQWQYNWQDASDFGVWYERCRMVSKGMTRIMQMPPKERAAALGELENLREETKRAADRLGEVKWSATVKARSADPDGFWRFDLPKFPEPITLLFKTEKDSFASWSDVKNGDQVRFACRLAANAFGDDPFVVVHMTLLENKSK